ncbi:MAG: L,D-transpeptidase [Verrucomicrobiales bacterium]|nr:L,D-transpeptidase [Verrucomicrobiales bacterium]
MKLLKLLLFSGSTSGLGLISGLALVLSSCATKPENEVPASMAVRYGAVQDFSKVRVRVSLNNRAVYVYEGDEPRFVAAVAIGKVGDETPTGSFKAYNRLPRKRSNTYGFYVKGQEIIPGKRSQMPSGYRYIGYPMPWWVEFKSGYGFHAGAVWPEPRTKGCLRLHRTIAEDFFSLVKAGTPIHVAKSLSEDATLGKNVPRPTDYSQPDHPRSVLITDAPFDSTDILF